MAYGTAVRSIFKDAKGVADVQLDCRNWVIKVAFKPDADVKKFSETMNKKATFKIEELKAVNTVMEK